MVRSIKEVPPVKRYMALFLAVLSLLLSGCSLLEREYSSVEPHANRYWEESGSDIMRAESYQDLVNILMMLVEEHAESGVLRLYLTEVDYSTALELMKRAVAELREETAIGSYVLDALDFDMEELRNSYYQVELYPVYRRTAEDVASIRESASSSAIYDLLVSAWEQDADVLTVRYSYLAEEPAELLANIRLLQMELEGISPETSTSPENNGDEVGSLPAEDDVETEEQPGEPGIEEQLVFPEGHTPWEVNFYPPDSSNGIVEIFFRIQQ